MHAFIRASGTEKLLIVSNFGGKTRMAKVAIPAEVAVSLTMQANKTYSANDLIWNEKEIKIEKLQTVVELQPFSAYIFKIQG